MEFAKNLLKKYGWKDGEGLGKNSDGIAKPLRAHMKFDNSGLGSNKATEFNDHWWERCYNDASENLKINVESDGIVEMTVKDEENGVEITTKSYSVNKLKKAKAKVGDNSDYGNFLYSSTLTNTGQTISNGDKVELNDIALEKVVVLSDEDLFKACGGLTAHKGARHGLKLSGKLRRLQQQEEELLAKMKQGENPFQKTNKDPESSESVFEKTKKAKHPKLEENISDNITDNICNEEVSQEIGNQCVLNRKNKKSKKRKSQEENLETTIETPKNEAEEFVAEKTKKKKKKEHYEKEKAPLEVPFEGTLSENEHNEDRIPEGDIPELGKIKSKNKRKKTEPRNDDLEKDSRTNKEDLLEISNTVIEDHEHQPIKKKKKKVKSKQEFLEQEDIVDESKKKKKLKT